MLTAEDDQERIRYETEIGFKLLDRTGSMEKDSGILCPTWTLQGNKRYVTMLRGQSGCVQTYDSLDSTSKMVKYDDIEGKAKGLHCIVKGMNGVENDLDDLDILPVQHLMVTEQAHCYLSNLDEEGKMEELFKLKGSHVHKTYLDHTHAFASTNKKTKDKEEKIDGESVQHAKSHLLKVISKDTPLQIWDING